MLDADIAVRLVTDPPPSPVWAWIDALKTLLATLAGALVAFWSTRALDRSRDRNALRSLAAGAAAEVTASHTVLDEAKRAAQAHDPDHNFDTITFGKLPTEPTPLIRAAFARAGDFPPSLAAELSRFILLQQQLRQEVEILQAMYAAGAITDKKDTGRRLAMSKLAEGLRDSLPRLETEFNTYLSRR